MSDNELPELDPTFFDRADAHIHLSNSQLADITPGKVSASMMYATARFNVYVSWIGFENAADMAGQRDETVGYFVDQYRIMLEENLDDTSTTSKDISAATYNLRCPVCRRANMIQ